MSQLAKPFVILLAMGLAGATHAQDTTTTIDQPAADTTTDGATAPASQANSGNAATPETSTPEISTPDTAPSGAAGEQPRTYTRATYDDWDLQCIKTEDGKDPCQIYQVIQDKNGGNVADISLFGLPRNDQAAAGATIMVPLDTLLTQNLKMSIDGAQAKIYPFTFCQPMGCFARIGLTTDELNAFKKGNKATISIVPLAAPTQQVNADISLKGFTRAYAAVNEANRESGALEQ